MFQDGIGQTADSAKKDDNDELVGGHCEYSLFSWCYVRFLLFTNTSHYIVLFADSQEIWKLVVLGVFECPQNELAFYTGTVIFELWAIG